MRELTHTPQPENVLRMNFEVLMACARRKPCGSQSGRTACTHTASMPNNVENDQSDGWIQWSKDGIECSAEEKKSYVAISEGRAGLSLAHYNARFNSRSVHPAVAHGDNFLEINWVKYKDPWVRFQLARTSSSKLVESTQGAAAMRGPTSGCTLRIRRRSIGTDEERRRQTCRWRRRRP